MKFPFALTVLMITVLMAGCAAPVSSPEPTTAPSPTPEPSKLSVSTSTPQAEPLPKILVDPAKVGVDVGGINDRGFEFIDLALTLRPWEVLTADDCPENNAECRLAPLDEDGWPVSDARTVFFDTRPFGLWWGADQANCPLCADGDFQVDMSGTYRLTFQGQARITSVETETRIQNQVYDPASNLTTADVVVRPGQGLLFLAFNDTRRTAGSPAGSGITGLHLIRPGWDANTRETINPAFIDALAPFGTLRFMNWTGGNNIDPGFNALDNTLEWSERNLPGRLQTRGEGVAWEYVIEVANRARKNLWVNIPIHASDDYIRGLAELLKRDLHPDAVIYIEYSNEVWNSLFSQYEYNRLAAESEVKAGNSNLDDDGSVFIDGWALNRYARRLVEISRIFGQVFGTGTVNKRFRVVVSWFILQPGDFEHILAWVDQNYGPPGEFFYAIAGAGYFGAPLTANSTLDQVFDGMRMGSRTGLGGRIAMRKIAERWGLQLGMYEAGPDNSGDLQFGRDSKLLDTLIHAHRDTRMGELILYDFYNNWFAHPEVRGDIINFFTLQSAYSRWGMWGLTEDARDTKTAKYRALAQLSGALQATPPAPPGLKSTQTPNGLALAWEASFSADGYRIIRICDGSTQQLAETQAVEWIDSNPEPGCAYQVIAFNNLGDSRASEIRP